jgi:tetratricopeptide (TPR) repeat protein
MQKALVLSLLLLLLLAGSVVMVFWAGQRALASFWESKALTEKNLETDERIDYLYRAANTERKDETKWRRLSQLLTSKAVGLAQTERSEDEQENQEAMEELQNTSRAAIRVAQRATEIDGKNSTNWSNLGDVYLNLIPYAQGSAKQAISAYDNAIKYNPHNPSLYLKKARAKFLLVQRLERQMAQLRGSQDRQAQARLQGLREEQNKALDESEKFAEKSIEKKQNYSSAHMFLTNLYDRRGELEQAIAQLSNVVVLNPQNAGLYFQLGLLHYKNDDLGKAESSFRQALSINSDYANARYFLGLVYARQEKPEEALSQFERVQENNPENEEVKQIISNLEAGNPPLAGIAPSPQEPAEREEAPVEDVESPQGGPTVPEEGSLSPEAPKP